MKFVSPTSNDCFDSQLTRPRARAQKNIKYEKISYTTKYSNLDIF